MAPGQQSGSTDAKSPDPAAGSSIEVTEPNGLSFGSMDPSASPAAMSPLPWQGHDDNKDKEEEEVEIEPLSETKGEKKKRSKLKESEKKADSRTKAKAKAATKKVRDSTLRDNLKQKAAERKETKDALKSVTEKSSGGRFGTQPTPSQNNTTS